MFHCVTAHCVELGVTGTFMVGKKEKITSEIKFEAFFYRVWWFISTPQPTPCRDFERIKKTQKRVKLEAKL